MFIGRCSTGSAAYATGTDIDGEAWLNPPSIGCDEYHAGAVTGPLSVGITASYTNVLMGFTVQLTALIDGRTTASSWDFGDGITVTNQPYTSHAWTALGDYAVVLRAYNESWPGGISATVIVHVGNGVHYVAADSANPVAPYTSWATAATNIQDAIAAAEPGATVMVVSNGSYGPISIPALMTVRSVNGPLFTIINGGHMNQCAYLGYSATLSGFTLTNGFTYYGGGGASGGILTNCVLTGNSDTAPYDGGGGAFFSTLDNCALIGNSAAYGGGGAYGCTLNNCTLTGNSASYGGGAYSSTLNNCIVYFNSSPTAANYDLTCTLSNCCTTPQPTNGFGNITNAPLFVDTNGWANLRLQSNSPCINAGNNTYAPVGPDLDGNPRIAGGTVDIGAYEFQSPVSTISYAWLQQYGLPINSSTDTADPDGDAVDNYHEWLAGTDPTSALSSPAKLTIAPSGAPPSGIILTWSTNAVGFTLQSTTNLLSPPAWVTNSSAPVVIAGQNTVTNPITGPQRFYRLIH